MTGSRQVVRLALVGGLFLALPGLATASPLPISIFAAPDKTYQNTTNNPCVFYGPGNCPHEPAGWLDPAGPTGGNFADPLNQTYAGADYTVWNNVVGTAFILGLDVNQEGSQAQDLTTFTIDFSGGVPLSYSFSAFSPTTVPSLSNGNGFADYVLAAGCAPGKTSDGPGGPGAIQYCSQYLPFIQPVGTDTITMTFSYGQTGNDGPDQVFVIPTDPGGTVTVFSVDTPEPASLILLGNGLAGIAAGLRRRVARPKK